jgi:hypothetical protein
VSTSSARRPRGPVRASHRRAVLLALLSLAVFATSASAAVADPAWRIDSISNTTVAPGATLQYLLQVTNVGDAQTNGETTLVATLPAGVTALSVPPPEANDSFVCHGDGPGPAPGILGAHVVTCTTTATVQPHRHLVPSLTVSIDPSGSGTLTSTFAVSGGGAPTTATTVDPTQVTAAAPQFGIAAFDGQVSSDAAGDPFTQAAGHPYSASTSIDFETLTNPNPLIGPAWPVQPTKDILVDLPPGFIGNPTAAPRCTALQLAGTGGATPRIECPSESQVGTTLVRVNGIGAANLMGPIAVYNLVPPPDVPARFGFNLLGTVVTFDARLRSDSDYGVTVDVHDISEGLDVAGTTLTLWGVPSDPSHDSERACPGQTGPFDPSLPGPSCPSSDPPVAFLRNPTACTAPGVGLRTTLRMDSWADPATVREAHFDSHLPPGYPAPPAAWGAPQGPTGCDTVPFAPTLTATPPTPVSAGVPTGFTFDLGLPQSSDPSTTGEADLHSATVTLPVGVRVNPAAAQGLAGCSAQQIGLLGSSFPDPFPIHFSESEPACPESSRLGTVEIHTPLLKDPLHGSIYLANPHENPFGSLLALYLTANAPGVELKLAGRVTADPLTGQLTTTFDQNPQLPFESLHLQLEGGPRAPLTAPPSCGEYTTHSQLSSWSARTVTSDSSFQVTQGENGPCTGPQFNPTFNAGTLNTRAGAYAPLTLQLQRSDPDSDFSSLSTVHLPPGLLADVSSVTTRCTDAQAAAAACPAVAHIGTVTAGAGAGSNPFYVGGDVYLTTPYKGAPFGLAIVVHAVAGPFDLGYVVVRAAIQIHSDGSITTLTDPFPTILQGIPLQVRDVRVNIDRPNFTINPTSCNPFSIGATAQSTTGQSASLSSRFQVGECRALAFHPAFAVSTSGHTSKANGASLHVHVATKEGPSAGSSAIREANIAKVEVQLPAVLPSRLTTLQKACTTAQFERDPAGCPAGAFVGTAVAHTPILTSPLSGPAILVSHGGAAFPDLVLVLQGEGVRIDLTGHTQIKKGITFSRFQTVPDAPVSSFDLTLPAGPHSVLTTDNPGTRNLCAVGKTLTRSKKVTRRVHGRTIHTTKKVKRFVAQPLLMPTTITAQNGAVIHQSTKVAVAGCPKANASTHPRNVKKAKRASNGQGGKS